MEEKRYTKLSDLVGKTFTMEKVWGFTWKKWDPEQRKMLMSDTYQEGYRKVYGVDTNHGKLDLGSGQIGNILEACMKNGVADLNNKTIEVKSNGKTGMDIRYFFNKIETEQQDTVGPVPEDTEDLLSQIPF